MAALFLAGYVPGLIWAVCCMIAAVFFAERKGYHGTPGKYSWKTLGVCTLKALPSLSLIVVVIGGIVGGIFTATEGSAIAVVYALILGICYRNITPPVGNTLFVAIKVGRTSLSNVLPYMLGYYVMILLGLLLVTYVPAISLGLPQIAGLI